MNVTTTGFSLSLSQFSKPEIVFWGGAIVLVLLSILFQRWRKRKPATETKPYEFSPATGRGCGLLFGGVFFLAGVAALFLITIRPVYRSHQAAKWPTVPGVVLSSRLAQSSGKSTTYRVDIHYRYVVNGQTLESGQYDSGGTNTYSGYRDRKQAVVHNHPPGRAVTVHYNPSDPSDAMLTLDLPPGTFSFVWFPILFIAIGIVLMIFLTRAAGQIGSRKPSNAKATPLAKSEVDVSAVRRKRSGQAIGLGLFTLFWNGFIFGIAITGWTWCLLPFLLIGLFLAAVTVQSVLQIFNPAVGVTFARMPIYPGQTVRVNYTLVGNIFSVRQLTFTLEGRERVTFRQGTDTRHETHVAWRLDCFETSNHAYMESGNFMLDLPPDAMTTFVATHNQFTWHLVVTGDIPGRPDIRDEIDVTVLPKEAC